MHWDVEYTDEFGAWWQELCEGLQDDITASVELLGISKNSISKNLCLIKSISYSLHVGQIGNF